jgi:hypothetical protein
MRQIIFAIAALMAVFASFATVHADERHGIQVYGAAKHDETVSKTVSESMSIQAWCYLTNDSVTKVVEFYKKQPGLEFMGGNEEGAMFKKDDIDITIQNPWMDLKTGKMMKVTLISIVKN